VDDGDRAAKPAQGAQYSERNLTPIGDEHPLEHDFT
jgi:hypothetical protein